MLPLLRSVQTEHMVGRVFGDMVDTYTRFLMPRVPRSSVRNRIVQQPSVSVANYKG